jgi:hypothetical protein
MDHRLTHPEVLTVRTLLARGWRHTEIARELNLSVWTIARIHDDWRHQLDPLTEDELPVDDAPPDYQAENLRRCDGCGAMVYVWPCIACRMATQTLRVPPAPEVNDEVDDEESRPTDKQRRWRRRQVREMVLGE